MAVATIPMHEVHGVIPWVHLGPCTLQPMGEELHSSNRAPGLLVGVDVSIADDVSIGGNAVVYSGTVIDAGCAIGDCAVVGRPPVFGAQSSAPRKELPPTLLLQGAVVSANAVVLAGATVKAGAIVADQAHLRERAVLGEDSVLGRGSSVDNDVVIGDRVRIQTNCYITAGSLIEDDAFIGPGVVTTNDNSVGRSDPDAMAGVTFRCACRVGGGVTICPGVDIGAESFVAAGAVVTRDVPPGTRWMGVPARQVD
jgi:acetyltransferase-like isoleucine patch superfamily enzyme